ncbi:MAG: putative capsular polysaccharide synthesis family protein [Actinomycetota bacterium]
MTRLRWRLRGSARRRRIVLVHTVGKVASTSLADGLQAALPHRTVLHVHRLTMLQDYERASRAHYEATGTIDAKYLRAAYAGSHLRRFRRNGPIDVVTAVRDPVRREISGFFFGLTSRHPDLAQRLRTEPATVSTDEVLRRLILERISESVGRVQHWIEVEFERGLGLDVLAAPFDPEVGYQLVEGDDARVVVLRTEDLRTTVEPAMHALLGVENVQLPRSNDASTQFYRDAYRRLSGDLRLPTDLADDIYDQPWVRHFYTDSEIDDFRRHWTR